MWIVMGEEDLGVEQRVPKVERLSLKHGKRHSERERVVKYKISCTRCAPIMDSSEKKSN